MKISQNWLREYIDFNITDVELTDLLTATGLEVEGFETYSSIKGGLKNLIVGEVVSCEKHIDADRLSICRVDIGTSENIQIVCGAPNVAQGQKVVVAPVQATIYPVNGEPFTIKKMKIRGVESNGMICAEDEIGLGENHDGILVLPEATKVGTAVQDLYNVYTDNIIEIGLTPNRSDANSHIGTARDLAAGISIVHKQETAVNWPSVEHFKTGKNLQDIKISVENKTACPIYAGVIIKDLKIGPSPAWLKNNLEAIGIKSMNNVVDITNFINHELGQPLHAFDLREIEGNHIIVKNLPENTAFTTLDNVERKLSSNDLMICNANKPMCIAGVYGGIDSGVKDDTTAIFLESAYFDPSSIRITELHHDLKTDAAAKFEKGIDPTIQVYAAKRAALLLQEIAGGTIASDVMLVQENNFTPVQINLELEYLNDLTGIDFQPALVEKILKKLDFKILKTTPKNLLLEVPLYRNEVTRPADVVEEVLRIYGFNNLEVSGKANFALTTGKLEIDALKNKLSNQLTGQGFFEIITNSITRSAFYTEGEKLVKPLNSINTHLDVMRSSMLYGGLESIAHNLNRGQKNLKFFEFGRVYGDQDANFYEQNKLAIWAVGDIQNEHWKEKPRKVSFQYAVGIAKSILANCGIIKTKTNIAENNEQFAYGVNISGQNVPLAKVMETSAKELRKLGIKDAVLYAEIDIDLLIEKTANKPIIFKQIPKFPSARRDLSLILDKAVSYGQVQSAVNKSSVSILKELNLFDVFESKEKLGNNKKAYAVSFIFQDEKQTLTDAEIDEALKKIIKNLKQNCAAEIRT